LAIQPWRNLAFDSKESQEASEHANLVLQSSSAETLPGVLDVCFQITTGECLQPSFFEMDQKAFGNTNVSADCTLRMPLDFPQMVGVGGRQNIDSTAAFCFFMTIEQATLL